MKKEGKITWNLGFCRDLSGFGPWDFGPHGFSVPFENPHVEDYGSVKGNVQN